MSAQDRIHGTELLRLEVQGRPRHLVALRGNGSTRLFDAHPLVESINARHRTKLTVASPEAADAAVTTGKTWLNLPAFPVDAFIAYEAPGTRLGKDIVFSIEGGPRVVLATGKYEGELDIALVALGICTADFKKTGASITLDIPDSRLIPVPDFPRSDGSYLPHEETGVPHGGKADSNPDARPLCRHDSSYVGLLVRNVDGGRHVHANYRAPNRLGVVAEVPEKDVQTIQALLVSPK